MHLKLISLSGINKFGRRYQNTKFTWSTDISNCLVVYKMHAKYNIPVTQVPANV